MHRAAAALLFLALSPGAAAAWVRVGGNQNVGVYADPASISRKGPVATMTSLLNFSSAQTERSLGKLPYRSQKDTREYDCNNERYRLIRFSLRADFMFGGAPVRSTTDGGEWNPVQPESLGAALWQYACGKKLTPRPPAARGR